jgi:hypothetical protein
MEVATLTADDIRAAWMARNNRTEDEAAEDAPEPEYEAEWRATWRRGAKILREYKVFVSSQFPMGADPDGKRLDEFVQKHNIVVWTEVFSSYVATSEQRCYMGLVHR